MRIPTVEEALKGETNIMLATVENDHPRVRPVTLLEHEGDLFVLTGSSNSKTKQIQANQNVEVLRLVEYQDRTGYIRFSAIAKIVEDPEIRKRVANASSYFYEYWESPESPQYTLLHLVPNRIEYMKPGQQYPELIKKFEFTK
ncbi:MAG: pyridoxamine 5'-phosphate oxidase family protein [Candidatus Thorarchaeota archaeon]